MPISISLDADVVAGLKDEAARLKVSFKVVGNRVLRRVLSTPSEEGDAVVLPADWYCYAVQRGADVKLPGIYEWKIDGVGSYIGRYTSINRPTRAYGRHVTKLLNNEKAYRPSNPDGYRRIHRELESAYRQGRRITLSILENPKKSLINARERQLIAERGTLNG